MGMRGGAVARLGLRLAAAISRDLKHKHRHRHRHQHHKDMMISKKVSSFSLLFIRKSSTSTSFSSATAAVAEVKKTGGGPSEGESKLELKDDRSLYLCLKGIDNGIVIRSIKLSDLLSPSWWWPTETDGWWLEGTNIFRKSGGLSYDGYCSGGNPKRRRDNCKFPSAIIKRMKEGPGDTLMMEELLPRKLYCVTADLCVDDTSEVFQVLDMSCSRKWVSLEAPPVNMSKTYPWNDLCAAAAGTKVEGEGLGNPVTWHCVHLGGQKLCIVVGKLQDLTSGFLFLITLEYELITNSTSSTLDIQYRWLSTRHFGYVALEKVSYPHLLTALVL